MFLLLLYYASKQGEKKNPQTTKAGQGLLTDFLIDGRRSTIGRLQLNWVVRKNSEYLTNWSSYFYKNTSLGLSSEYNSVQSFSCSWPN